MSALYHTGVQVINAAMQQTIDDIHDDWFGALDNDGMSAPSQNALWFGADAATDNKLRERYGQWLAKSARGELNHWSDTDRGLVAFVILIDQFSRNIHRGTAEAFAADHIALAASQKAIAQQRDHRLPAIHRVFLYLPLEHTEDLETQEQCVMLYEALEAQTSTAQTGGYTQYARAHRDVIAQFGRFPHRNAILGRDSTHQEIEYLQTHGGF